MPKALPIILAVVAILGLLGGSHWFAYRAGRDAESVDRQAAIDRALEQQRLDFAAQQAAVTDIETGGRDAAADIATGADARAEEIAHADLSPEPDAAVDREDPAVEPVRCRDPFGPEYYRLLRATRGDPADPATSAGAVPGTDRG